MIPLGQHPLPEHVVAHVSDPHLLADRLQYGAVDTRANLERALSRLRNLEVPPQAIVFTGDLADRAEPGAYRALRETVEPIAADLGAEVVWVMGNHDERAPYARELFGVEAGDDDVQDRVHDVAGLRIVALDTSVPGYHHGRLTEAQLDWLREVLATPAEHGTLLAMHHPPIPVPLLRSGEVIELHDQESLADVVRGTDVRAILGGHFHYTSWSTFAGVPVSVAAATCYTVDPAPEQKFLSGVDGHQALTMLHLYGHPTDRVVHTVVNTAAAPEVSGYPLSIAAEVEALSFDERVELLSRKDSPVWANEDA